MHAWKVPGRADHVEIPQRLLKHLEDDTFLGAELIDSGRGGFTLSGTSVTDPEALSQMDIPEHETCVEVPKNKEVWFGGAVAG